MLRLLGIHLMRGIASGLVSLAAMLLFAILLLGWDKFWMGGKDFIPFAYGGMAIVVFAAPAYGLAHTLLRRGDSTNPSGFPTMAGLITVSTMYGVALVPAAFFIFGWLSQAITPSDFLVELSLGVGALLVSIASNAIVLTAIAIRRRALTAQ